MTFDEWFKSRGYPDFPEHYPLITQNAMYAAWVESRKHARKAGIRCWVVLGDAGGRRAFVTEEEARLVAGDWAKVIQMIEES